MMVSTMTWIFIGIMGLISIAVPVAAFIYFKKKFHISWIPILVGALVFVVFSQILEKALHIYVLRVNDQTAEWLDHPWIYAIYGALAAGIFEEVGRYIGFRFFLKKYRRWRDGLANGFGHGGIEAILVGVLGAFSYFTYALLINTGEFDHVLNLEGGQTSQLLAVRDQLLYHSGFVLLGGVERIFAFVFHLGLSMFMLYIVRNRKPDFLIYAILIHAIVDFLPALGQVTKLNMIMVEVPLFIAAVISVVFIVKSRSFFDSSKE